MKQKESAMAETMSSMRTRSQDIAETNRMARTGCFKTRMTQHIQKGLAISNRL